MSTPHDEHRGCWPNNSIAVGYAVCTRPRRQLGVKAASLHKDEPKYIMRSPPCHDDTAAAHKCWSGRYLPPRVLGLTRDRGCGLFTFQAGNCALSQQSYPQAKL